MNITHKLNTEITNVTASTPGYEITTNCQSVLFVNTGTDDVKLFFNGNDANHYEMQPGAMLTIDVNSNNEMITDMIKVEFSTSKAPNLKIVKQTKHLIL